MSSCMEYYGAAGKKAKSSYVSYGGPWGGEGGSRWDDGAHSSIRQVIITHGGAGINSIQLEYDAKGCSVWSERHGGSGGAMVDKLKLDHPDEHVISVSGFYGVVSDCGPVVVRSLVIETNRRRFGPLGAQKGSWFSLSLSGGKIVGFFGRSGLYLDSLGVYVKGSFFNPRTAQMGQGMAQMGQGMAHMGMASAGTGLSHDLMAAFNEKMRLNSGSGGLGEYERREKVVLPLGGLGRVECAREKENHMAANQDHAFRGYESREKVYSNYVGAENYHNLNNMRQNDGNIYTRNDSFTDYETKEKGKTAVCYGPWGGSGGLLFDDGIFNGVREIHLSRSLGSGVVSIRVCYDINGQAVWGNKNGGARATRVDKITFDYPDEVLTRVNGYYGSSLLRGGGPTVVQSVTFYSNKKKYGPFGDEQGIPFSTGQKEGIVVGFHGRKGSLLDSIGIHFLETKLSLPNIPSPYFDSHTTTATTHDLRFTTHQVFGPVRDPIPSGPEPLSTATVKESGPWGGSGGIRWDDGVFSGIKKILLTKGFESIYSIEIEYDCNGISTWSAKHGSNNEGICHVVKFEYPQEVLTHISGYYGSIGGDECKKIVKSLTFHSNRGVYGPFGEEIGTYFSSAKTQTKIVGFHGNSGCHLYAIGFHTQPYFPDRVDSVPINAMLHKIFP